MSLKQMYLSISQYNLALMAPYCLFFLINFRSKVLIIDNWQLENSPAIVVKIGETNLYASVSSQREEKGKPIYWVAPKGYLGEKVFFIELQS